MFHLVFSVKNVGLSNKLEVDLYEMLNTVRVCFYLFSSLETP